MGQHYSKRVLTGSDDLNQISRRQLLKTGVASGMAIAAAGVLSGAASEAKAQSARGGRLRVGLLSGGDAETLDPNKLRDEIDIARAASIFERLVTFDLNSHPVNALAEEFSVSPDARTWKIKLRTDVVWHDGSPFTADDVVYSLRYMADPSNKSRAQSDLAFLSPNQVRGLDKTTVEIALDQPNAILPTILSARSIWIFKAGTTNFEKPIGTGPFKFQSFTRGVRSLFVRNPDYRKPPLLDELEFISLSNRTAIFNALVAGEIDAMNDLDFKLVGAVEENPSLRVLRAHSGFWVPLTMAVDIPPFTDRRVREAFKLMTDRRQMIENAISGQGSISNDLFSNLDPDYASEIPQREYDPEKARSLLKAAGHENLSVSLYTSDAGTAMLESATLFAEQAKAAGVTVTLDKVPADQFWSLKYLKAGFSQSTWAYRPLTTQIAQCVNTDAPYNETHWRNPEFDKLTQDARATVDPNKRRQLWVDAQRMLWNDGGYIIWGFFDNVDAYSAKVKGLKASAARWLGFYDFTEVTVS